MMQVKLLEKQEFKPKVSTRNEIISNRTEMNKIEIKTTKNQWIKKLFLQKNKKKNRHILSQPLGKNTQINPIKNEKGKKKK